MHPAAVGPLTDNRTGARLASLSVIDSPLVSVSNAGGGCCVGTPIGDPDLGRPVISGRHGCELCCVRPGHISGQLGLRGGGQRNYIRDRLGSRLDYQPSTGVCQGNEGRVHQNQKDDDDRQYRSPFQPSSAVLSPQSRSVLSVAICARGGVGLGLDLS